MNVIYRVKSFLAHKTWHYKKVNHTCFTDPINTFESEYPKYTKWDGEKFDEKLEKYLKNKVKKAVDHFIIFYYDQYADTQPGWAPSASDLKADIMQEVEEDIRDSYRRAREYAEEQAAKKRERKERRSENHHPREKNTTSNRPTKRPTPNQKPTRNTYTDSSEAVPSYATASIVDASIDDFISSLEEIERKEGPNPRIRKVLDLAEKTPQSSEELEIIAEKIRTAIRHLLSFDKRVQKFFIQRYGMRINHLTGFLCEDWETSITDPKRKQKHTRTEEEEKDRVPHLKELLSILFRSDSPRAKHLWEFMNLIQRDIITIRDRKERIQELLRELLEKDPIFKAEIEEEYDVEDVEDFAETICSEWEKKVRENGGKVWETAEEERRKKKKPTTEEPQTKETPGVAEMVSHYINTTDKFEKLQNTMKRESTTDDIESYIYITDQLIKEYIRELREYLEQIKKNNPESIDKLMRLVEEVFGIVLNNEREIDAFLELIEAELHYEQIQICLARGDSIERVTELEQHNARKIEREYEGAPIQVKELILKEEPNYGFDTNQEIFVEREGLPLPEDYEDKYVIGTHFRKSLYEAELEKTEESGSKYHVVFNRKNWSISIKPTKEIVVLDENGNIIEPDSYLLIEIQRELTGMTKKRQNRNQY